MNEGKRFDLAYETMPWHKIDTVVFDIGRILIRFSPVDILKALFPGDEEKQRFMLEKVYESEYWPLFDRGTMTYEEAARELMRLYGGEYDDYMLALTGWFDWKTPIEEGWKAAARCKRAGKRLLLLSNYPELGYLRLRERFADRFQIFDGGVISCYEHLLKPEAGIYETLIERYGLEPSRTLFIDDTLANVEGAMRAGIHGFHAPDVAALERFFL